MDRRKNQLESFLGNIFKEITRVFVMAIFALFSFELTVWWLESIVLEPLNTILILVRKLSNLPTEKIYSMFLITIFVHVFVVQQPWRMFYNSIEFFNNLKEEMQSYREDTLICYIVKTTVSVVCIILLYNLFDEFVVGYLYSFLFLLYCIISSLLELKNHPDTSSFRDFVLLLELVFDLLYIGVLLWIVTPNSNYWKDT